LTPQQAFGLAGHSEKKSAAQRELISDRLQRFTSLKKWWRVLLKDERHKG
jgi:hypothetical protein